MVNCFLRNSRCWTSEFSSLYCKYMCFWFLFSSRGIYTWGINYLKITKITKNYHTLTGYIVTKLDSRRKMAWFLQIYHWRNLFTPALLGRGNYNSVILSCLFAQLITVKKKIRQLQDYTSLSLINLSLASMSWIDSWPKFIFWFATDSFFLQWKQHFSTRLK